MHPRFPIYIVSKGRWESRLTSKALDYMGVPYYLVCEEQEYDQYASVIDKDQLLILPQHYLDEYDTFWERADDNKTGPGAARNFAWDHSIENGHTWHWVMDDNLVAFYRLNRNEIWRIGTSTAFKIMEDFVLRYENIAIAGPNYESFCKKTDGVPPFVINTRIYSCLLIRNDIPYRWRGRYNEDTDLSLRALKDGWCTVQFNPILQEKVTTQRMKGGNTDEFYKNEGTIPKSQILEDMHPDVAKVVYKFNRWHHHVDYRPFKKNLLKRKDDIDWDALPDVDNYGLELIEISKTAHK